MKTYLVATVALGLLAACGDGGATAADGGPPDARADAGAADAGPVPDPWPVGLPAAGELVTGGDLTVARTIIHLHSPLSHDACDGEGWVDGDLADADCLAHLREAMCTLRIDAAMLTDHAPHVEEVSFEAALWMEATDEAITDGAGATVGAWWICPDGHRTAVTVGAENRLMPIALDRHPLEGVDADALRAAYDADGPDAVATFRDAGALVLVPHTESRGLDYLRGLELDGIEIYNIHANLAPDIREEHLGLEGYGFVDDLLAFTDRRSTLEPDLAFLAFFDENHNDLGKWDALLAEGRHLPGLAGTDAHENTFPDPMPDGERADSYRRLMRWFSNHVLVETVDLPSLEAAIDAGRYYVAFEAFGSPVGFSFIADDAGTLAQMGETTAVGSELWLSLPALPDGHPASPAPRITARILRAEAGGAVEVASGSAETLSFVADVAGAYRAEVRMVPEHTRPYLGRRADDLVREVVWIYSNPIYVE